MSMETWVDEFYPIHARQVLAEHAVEHSLQKWRGFLPENLDKHKITYSDVSTYRTGGHCSLCKVYYADEQLSCGSCPLNLSRNNTPCDQETDEEEESPFSEAVRNHNPIPMIHALEKSRQWEKEQS